MNHSLGKIIAFVYGPITRRLYSHTAIVALFLLIVISISIWSGNTLTMITAIARFERTHTVSRVEAMVSLLKFLENKKPGDLATFQVKIAITQSYNKVFSRLLEMRKDTTNAEFVRILENTFSETDHKTAVIIVNRIKVLYWHPLLKELVSNAVGANAAGERLKAQAALILEAKNEVERVAAFAEIEKTEKEFISFETSFSKHCSELSNEISAYGTYVSIVLLIFSAGFTGMLAYMIAKADLKQAETYTSNLEKEIQERKKAEQSLQKERDLSMDILNAQPSGIYRIRVFSLEAWDKDAWRSINRSPHVIELASEPFCKILGATKEALENNPGMVIDLIYPDDRERFAKKNEEAAVNLEEFIWEGRLLIDGVIRWVRFQSLPRPLENGDVLWTGALIDITERKMAEEEKQILEQQFQQTQKLESLGVLSGGIAHDFNNILAIIMGNCSLANMHKENASKYIPEIEKAAQRAAELCRQMLSYAGKAQFVQTNVNFRSLVGEMVDMLKKTIPQNVEIKLDSLTAIPFILGDSGQLNQIVMNLIINASEAIGKEFGEISVSLTEKTVNGVHSEVDYNGKAISPGSYVCLEVTDNGCGMDEEIKWRIFEPFYTTKFSGRGLGMSAVLGIIMSHNGALQLHSQLGQGTTFKVFLPARKGVSDKGDKVNQASETSWHGSGTILLVEDEDQIRFVAKELLELFGFTVIEAVNGKEALDLYQVHASEISLVVTDMGMPIMDGYALFDALKRLNSALPIIISSGFGDADVTSRIDIYDIAGLISKPYTSDRLREVLKDVLEG